MTSIVTTLSVDDNKDDSSINLDDCTLYYTQRKVVVGVVPDIRRID